MDNKITKKRINDHLEYDWYKYILLIAAAVALVVFAFYMVNKERDVENIDIFFTCYDYKSNDYAENVMIGANKSDYDASVYGKNILSSIYFDFQAPDSGSYAELFSTRGQISSDVLIVHKSYFVRTENIDGQDVETYQSVAGYLPIDNNILALIGIENNSGIELLRIDNSFKKVDSGGTVYGIRIDNLSNISKLADFKTEDDEGKEVTDEFYMFISRSSSNIGSYNSKAKDGNKQLFYCLKVFFEMYA